MGRGFIVIGLITFLNAASFCQTSVVHGVVRDSLTLEPLPGANVMIEGTTIGTRTDEKGSFTLPLPQQASTIVASYVGYKRGRMNAAPEDELVFRLIPMTYELQNVNVYARMTPSVMSGYSFVRSRNQEVENITGISQDPFRAVQTLPGVSSNNEASAQYSARGGTSDENLLMINGVQVFSPFHLQEDPLTSIGIFNIDMVKKIDFADGVYGVEYGDALSSVLTIDYRRGDPEAFKGKVDASFISLSLLGEGPVANHGSFLVGFRKSYLEPILRAFGNSPGIHPAFYDLQGQVDYDIGPANALRLTAIYSADDYRYDPTWTYSQSINIWGVQEGQTSVVLNNNQYQFRTLNYSNRLLSLRSMNAITPDLLSETVLSYYEEKSAEDLHLENDQAGQFVRYPQYFSSQHWKADGNESLRIGSVRGSTTLTAQISSDATLKAGGSVERLTYADNRLLTAPSAVTETNVFAFPDTTVLLDPPDPQYNDTTALNSHAYKYSAFAEANVQLFEHFIASIGARVDYFGMNKQLTRSPRVSLSYRFPSSMIVRLGWGMFYQAPLYKQLRVGEPSSGNTRSPFADHYTLGLEQEVGQALSFKLEGYYKKYHDLISTQRLGDGSLVYGFRQNDAEGFARGIDFYGAFNASAVRISLSYGYLEARENKIDGHTPAYPRYTDQRHTASLIATFPLEGGWELTLRGTYGSGYAFTPYVLTVDRNTGRSLWSIGPTNSAHYPAYERCDLRVTKQFLLFGNPLLGAIDILNVINRRNILSYSYTYGLDGSPLRKEKHLLPLIPSLGVSYSF